MKFIKRLLGWEHELVADIMWEFSSVVARLKKAAEAHTEAAQTYATQAAALNDKATVASQEAATATAVAANIEAITTPQA